MFGERVELLSVKEPIYVFVSGEPLTKEKRIHKGLSLRVR